MLSKFKIAKRNKPAVVGLICAICCAVCVGLFILSVDDQARAAEAEALSRYGGEQIEVCVARRDIAAGDVIVESDVETKSWIASLLPEDAVLFKSDAVGKQVGSAILKGEVISSKRFGIASADIEVPDGYVAISVPAKDVQAVGGSLKAGMRIDVYATGQSSTTRLASSVLVLATSSSEDGLINSSGSSWLTLAVSPEKIREIVSASQTLELYFTLPSELALSTSNNLDTDETSERVIPSNNSNEQISESSERTNEAVEQNVFTQPIPKED